MGGVLTSSEMPEKSLQLSEFNKQKANHRGILLQLHNLILRWPYLVEDTFGVNMNYYCALNVPSTLLTLEERRLIKANEFDDLKSMVFRELVQIDDPIDIYSKHTILHDAVVLDREELFYFALQQGANPMVRDANGYTPLLKAASLCRMDMSKYLIEKRGVDPRHTDPYGNTPREKAQLYLCEDVAEYLAKMELKAKTGEFKPKDHSIFTRSSKLHSTFIDY